MEFAETVPRSDGAGLAEGDASSLISRLRAATAQAHARLETALALIPADRDRFIIVLEAFLGFHRVWEPAMRAQSRLAPLFEGRTRRGLLERDLLALGCTPQALAALPDCPRAAGLAADPYAALGSLYVMEGSTLGGRVISAALAEAGGFPPGGLAYFNPYGERTGAMWRAFRAEAEAFAPVHTHGCVERGALDCFALLTEWLPGRLLEEGHA